MKVDSIIASIGGLALMGIVGYMMYNITDTPVVPPPVPKPQADIPKPQADIPPTIPVVNVLVAQSDLQVGTVVRKENLKWQIWPAESVVPTYVTKDASLVDAGLGEKRLTIADFAGAVVRLPIAAGQPMIPGLVARASTGAGTSKAAKPTSTVSSIQIYRGAKLQIVKVRRWPGSGQ